MKPLPSLTAPRHLVAANPNDGSAVAARDAWVIAAYETGYTTKIIADALDITTAAVRWIRRRTQTAQIAAAAPPTAMPRIRIVIPSQSISTAESRSTISLPRAPWDEGEQLANDPRHETRPRGSRMIGSRKTQAERAIDAIRAMAAEARRA